MKKIITSLALILTAGLGYSQYYQGTYLNVGRNPLGLNTDVEQTAGVLVPQGWTQIQGSSASPVWSPSQSIPFTFNFNNSAVTNYKVSTSGVLTFDVGTSITAPTSTNAAIPSALIPDNSVCVWGISGLGANDAIITKTFGTAPHRQHWVMFSSYSVPGMTGTAWTYWGIVMEETTDRIFVVDMRTYYTSPLTLTVGLQFDNTTAISIAGSPNLGAVATNGGSADTPDDNTYYEFGYGTRNSVEAELTNIAIPDIVGNNANVSISGDILNSGSSAITSFDIKYQVDGGAIQSETFTSVNVASGSMYNFSLSSTWTATPPGNKNFKFWVDSPNSATDPLPYNDSIAKSVTVNTGGSGTKKVLLEEFTTAPCQFCPDGEVIVNGILATIPEVIAVGIHAGFLTDAMTIPAHSAYASAFTTGAPTACIDRKIFPGETRVGHSRTVWAANANAQTSVLTPLDINLSGTVTGTNTVDITVDINFLDFLSNYQDARVTLFVVEDSVVGTGSGYNQINYYNTVSGHPYFGTGNPIVGYPHRHVVRDVPTGTWGDANYFTTPPIISSTYSKTYSVTLNPAWDKNKMSFVAFVNYYNPSTGEDAREIINVNDMYYENLTVGIEDKQKELYALSIYPNPTRDLLTVDFTLNQSENVSVEILNILGEVVSSNNYGVLATGKQRLNLNLSDQPNGFYFVKITAGNSVQTQKVSVIK